MDNPKIEIKSINKENGSMFTEIYVDGHKLNGVRKFKLEQKVGNCIPILTVDLNALNVSTDTMALIFQEGFGKMEIKFKDTKNGLPN